MLTDRRRRGAPGLLTLDSASHCCTQVVTSVNNEGAAGLQIYIMSASEGVGGSLLKSCCRKSERSFCEEASPQVGVGGTELLVGGAGEAGHVQ